MSYIRRVKGLFVLSLNHHIEDFTALDRGKRWGGGLCEFCSYVHVDGEKECVWGEQSGVNLKLCLCVWMGKCSVVVSLKWNSWLFVSLASWPHRTKPQWSWTLVDVWGLGNWNAGSVCLAYSFPSGTQSWAISTKLKDGPTAPMILRFFVSNLKHCFLLYRKFSGPVSQDQMVKATNKNS